jgi:hypothetical protein
LLKDVVVSIADCFVLVVNELTWMDQQAIEALAKVGGNKPIIVIHN